MLRLLQSPPGEAEASSSRTTNNPSLMAAAMVSFAVVVLVLLFAMSIRGRRRRLERVRALYLRRLQMHQDVKEKQEARYTTIESWLVNKHVIAHDSVCEILRGTGRQSSTKKDDMDEECGVASSTCSVSSEDQEEEEVECPICYESFQVRDIVSWSPSPSCEHVFHHFCIKEWLLSHSDCPCCRETFLPVDNVATEYSMKTVAELIQAQNYRRMHCFYCKEHGTVRVPNSTHQISGRLDRETLDSLIERARENPDRAELAEIRSTNLTEIGSQMSCNETSAMMIEDDGDADMVPEDDDCELGESSVRLSAPDELATAVVEEQE